MSTLGGPALPSSILTEEVHFAVASTSWSRINARLKADEPNEGCVFVLARPSRGARRLTLILGEAIWPVAGDVRAAPHSLELSADYISRAIDAAIDAGALVGVVLIHTHPSTDLGEGVARFSPRDDWYESRLFPTVTQGRPNAISGSIVIAAPTGQIDARIWWGESGARTQNAEVLRVVGPAIAFRETPHSRWEDHLDPAVMDRSTRIWGAEGRRRLQNIRLGIVGAGGTGSIVLISAATMGVGNIMVSDADVIRAENLHRMLGATPEMRDKNKAVALADAATRFATAQPFHVEAWPESGTSAEGLRRLKDCDLIFCCVDKYGPRVPLNDLAYAHLIPTIDMASWIHATNGRVDAIMTHAHVWSPGIPCAWCRQNLTSLRLMREAQASQRGIEERIPYGLRLNMTDGVEPSVLPLNLAGVGLAMMEFMQVALGITDRTPRDLKFFLPQWELDESDLDSRPSCVSESQTGLGDEAVIRPV